MMQRFDYFVHVRYGRSVGQSHGRSDGRSVGRSAGRSVGRSIDGYSEASQIDKRDFGTILALSEFFS